MATHSSILFFFLFQYSYLENPIDRGAWWAIVHGVIKNWTQRSNLTRMQVPYSETWKEWVYSEDGSPERDQGGLRVPNCPTSARRSRLTDSMA